MGKTSAAEVLDRLQIVFGVSSDSALCEATGTPRATLGNWRSRDSVPYPLCVSVAQSKGISLDWLLTGEGPTRRSSGVEAGPASSNSPEEEAILNLYRSLAESDKREIQNAAEEKKRIRDIEQRLEDLTTALADVKKHA
ncbi:helix-turn-helix domain-containing protein [Pseudomonas atacamensis]|uniref:helix-turn-helix domain-containing protein n=1 Tax=Pseudomonas atacamensis TaxID=2565368 RepID=UPI00244B6D83|nr:helix-turn-helix domain-containing protein [Pseudomonas atacamensis]MDH2080338.1 helix-turn-helix domain containing protein [Pseudomonas atacamensis]